MRYLTLILCLLAAGCESFNLGAVIYIPHGQTGTVSVAPPGAASAPIFQPKGLP